MALALKAPPFSHWVRTVEVREDRMGDFFVCFYAESLTSLRIKDLDQLGQQFNTDWVAQPSSKERLLWICLREHR